MELQDLNLPEYKGSEMFLCPKCEYSVRASSDMKSCKHCKTTMVPQEEDIKWNWEAQKIFLTYPKTHVYLTPKLIVDRVREKLADETVFKKKHTLEKYLVTREFHADQTYHIHAFFEFGRKLRTKQNDFFDITVNIDTNHFRKHHPNWSKPRNVYRVYDYIMKEGPYNEQTGLGYIKNIDYDFKLPEKRILDESVSYEQFCEKMIMFTDGYWRHFYLNKLAKKKFYDANPEDELEWAK